MSAPTTAPEELVALADKYREMGRLRRAHARGLPQASAEDLRALARAFPGALRELDRVPLEELGRREVALREAATSGDVAPWMAWMATYHGVLRGLLHLRGMSRDVAAASSPAELARCASERARHPVAPELASRVISQSRCSLLSVALSEVALRHGVDEATVRAAILPSR